ncbi:subtilisin-like protease SBT5.3 isoform X2 [Lathyrus oleraceus]|uniref:Variant 2, Subtilisin-like protease SBT5.3 n=1 Tax=Pisum sativum TaxID=3888 RepID=A0A9D4WPE9_PEA|nr:subtilisin-like protease SBT5.3 isoform X2 [Pisum sativum]KAI5406633.1 variant 2, Subtilisin-like protease SBT5.3 [Pisum sativum]
MALQTSPTIFFLLLILLVSLFHTPTFALKKKSYVVYLGSHSHGSEFSSVEFNRVTDSHYEFLGSFLKSSDTAKESIFYSYTRHINGFAATLEEQVAAEIAKHPNVVSVFENNGRKLHTTRSWGFMGLEDDYGVITSNSIWNKARFGEGVIIANLDTGVWPESKSFNDEGFGPIPSKWRGICEKGSDLAFHCNRKLIGARYFNKGYASRLSTPLNSSSNTPRDNEGHGSHTLSTAGGNMVPGVSVFGQGYGTAKGGSPKARVASYKVCWPPVNGDECFDADILAAFDMAIHDGVDVLSLSLGGSASNFFNDSVAIGSFHAAKKGIVVVCSAGNSGPNEATVENLAPWYITVGASTMDREFPSYVVLGNNLTLKGESLSATRLAYKLYPIIKATDAKLTSATNEDAVLCQNGTLDPNKVKGKIVLCLRGINARVDKGQQALQAGAVGMVLANDIITGNEIIADPHVLPASHINFSDGLKVFNYVNSSKAPVAYIAYPTTKLHTKPAPFMAAFSSKGPNTMVPEILKPDITAPGVSVIAAYTEAEGPTNQVFDYRRIKFNSISGTSMSCPHISGIAGLLKAVYPSWSPAAIKSAIMTTATTLDNEAEPLLNASFIQATPFSYGAGHVQPNKAMDPGLVYDATMNDYFNVLCALGYNETEKSIFSNATYYCHKNFSLLNLNYPSITVPNLSGSVTVKRTLKNVGAPATYIVHVQNPDGITVSVKPSILEFKHVGEEKRFEVKLKANKGKVTKSYVFGKMTWSDGKHYVKSPLVVKGI